MPERIAPQRIFFRSYEPEGYRFANRSAEAERVTARPNLDDLAGLAAPAWFEHAKAFGDFVDLWGNVRESLSTKVRVVYDGGGLFVGVRMEEPRPKQMRGLVPAGHPEPRLKIEGVPLGYPPERDDNVQIAIDPAHSGRQYFQFLVTNTGYAHVRAKEYAYNESVQPRAEGGELQQVATAKIVEAGWAHRAVVAPNGEAAWYAFFSIPWTSLGLDGPPGHSPVGFQALRTRSAPELTHESWTVVGDPDFMVAMDFGDLYLKPPAVTLDAVDFGRPVLGRNELKLLLGAPSGHASVKAEVQIRRQRTGEFLKLTSETPEIEIEARGAAEASLPYTLDWRENKIQELILTVRDADSGAEVYRGLYELGRFAQIPTEDQHHWDEPQPNPSPDDPNFVEAKRNYLLSRLPRFERKTTAQGAPSDFCVESEDGQTRFNFMQPGVCRKIAAFIESKFDNDLDRMAAASLLVHQKVFAMHCAPLSSLHNNFTPESALRLNGGHCYSRALSLAGVMREINYAAGPRKGQPYDATIMFVLGHVIVRVREDGENHLFDPTFGSFYYAKDNKRFATEKELGADLSIADRYIFDRHKDFRHPASHAAAAVGNVVWPAGAPE